MGSEALRSLLPTRNRLNRLVSDECDDVLLDFIGASWSAAYLLLDPLAGQISDQLTYVVHPSQQLALGESR